jgi:hypothetical protein
MDVRIDSAMKDILLASSRWAVDRAIRGWLTQERFTRCCGPSSMLKTRAET